MADVLYDIDKLDAIKGLDTEVADDFADRQAYFNALNNFVERSDRYLRGYTASVVVYNESVRKDFIDETETVRNTLKSAGLDGLALMTLDLEDAVESNSPETLSDWLLRFRAKMEEMAKRITSARITDEPAKQGEPAKQDAGKALILAVDDKPELLTTIVGMLKDSYKVIGATSGSTAINIINKQTPEMFLLDIEMPQMDGYELARRIRMNEKYKTTPIIFLTGRNTREDVMMAITRGGNDYIIKPVEKDVLLSKIRKYMGEKP